MGMARKQLEKERTESLRSKLLKALEEEHAKRATIASEEPLIVKKVVKPKYIKPVDESVTIEE